MSDPVAAPLPSKWSPLPPYLRRVIGVLIEKEKTHKSADSYPMTLNSITIGCNQKSNRDPLYELDEVDVDETLIAAQKLGLVMKLTGGRAERWRHLMYDVWKITKYEMAIMAELLLRGAQTEGDLRGRASRMNEIPDLDELRNLLKNLASRNLVVYVTPPDRRGTIVTHGFHTPEEFERLKIQFAHSGGDSEPAARQVVSSSEPKAAGLFEEIQALKERVSKLESELATLKALPK
jgi:uncharacterized protein